MLRNRSSSLLLGEESNADVTASGGVFSTCSTFLPVSGMTGVFQLAARSMCSACLLLPGPAGQSRRNSCPSWTRTSVVRKPPLRQLRSVLAKALGEQNGCTILLVRLEMEDRKISPQIAAPTIFRGSKKTEHLYGLSLACAAPVLRIRME
jgi:hypothetical protein